MSKYERRSYDYERRSYDHFETNSTSLGHCPKVPFLKNGGRKIKIIIPLEDEFHQEDQDSDRKDL
jgi:hypothetical protein